MSHFAKSLERRVRRAFIRSFRWLPRSRRAAMRLPESPRILLIRHDRIGDAIISTPLFALLRERFPTAGIDVLLGRRNAAVAPLLPDVDECLVLPSTPNGVAQMVSRIRRRRYDVAINLLAKDSASGSFLTAVSGAALRIGFAGETASAYDIAVEKPARAMHIVSETSLLLTPLGIGAIGDEPVRNVERLRVVVGEAGCNPALVGGGSGSNAAGPGAANPDPTEPNVELYGSFGQGSTLPVNHPVGVAPRLQTTIINISGSGPEKFWGEENYVALASAVRSLGSAPLFAGSPGDTEVVATLARRSNAAALPPTGSYTEFAAMLSTAGLIVTPDTSVVHLAAALRKPTLMLVASASEEIPWCPWGTAHRVVRHNSSIRKIPVEEVITALRELVLETIDSAQSSPRA